MKRFGVLSNPRSGTSLLVHLMLTGFYEQDLLPIQTELDGSDIYHYRILMDKVFENCREDTYFLFILRDPRDVAVSVHPSTNDEYGYTIDFKSWINNFNEFLSVLSLCPDRVLVVRYEDLTENPDEVQKDIAIFMGLDVSVPFSLCVNDFSSIKKDRIKDMDFEMGGTREINTSRIGRWRHEKHANRIQKQFEITPEMKCILKVLNYE